MYWIKHVTHNPGGGGIFNISQFEIVKTNVFQILGAFNIFYAIFPFLEVHGHLGFAQHDASPPAAGAEPPHSWKLEQTLWGLRLNTAMLATLALWLRPP